jgi:uncharacterized protein with NRDE domain
MCTVIILNEVHPRWPLLVAANRDEFFARPSTGPQLLSEQPRSVGGRDQQAGGTWMGVSPSGFFAALTNQRAAVGRDDSRRSRGEVVVELMRRGTAPSARCWITGVEPDEYNPFNVVYGAPGQVWVSHGVDGLKPQRLEVGVQVLPNERLNSKAFPKVNRARALCSDLPDDDEALFAHLQRVLSDGECPTDFSVIEDAPFDAELQGRLHALQVKTPVYGTCSASIFGVSSEGETRYLFADGPPDVTAFEDHSTLVRGQNK